MPRRQSIIYEDATATPQPVVDTFDVIWKRVSNDPTKDPTGPDERDHDGIFIVRRAPPPAPNSTASTSSTSSVSMVVEFIWSDWSADFVCEYLQTSDSYDHFAFVNGSMSETLEVAAFAANEFFQAPNLDEEHQGLWKFDVEAMLDSNLPCYVELWAKKRVNGVATTATDEDLSCLSLGQYAPGDGEDEEVGGDEEEQKDGSSEGEEGDEREDGEAGEDGLDGEDQEMDSSEEDSDAEGEEEEKEEEDGDA